MEALIELVGILVDFGLVVLIWMVQLVIYPNYCFHTADGLCAWHRIYKPRIGYIVGPLMLVQLGVSIYQMFIHDFRVSGIIYFLLVISTWIITALIFVPLHNKITQSTYTEEHLEKLVKWNWWRVLLWTLIFILSILLYLDLI